MKTTNLIYTSKKQFDIDIQNASIDKNYTSCLVQLFTSVLDIDQLQSIINNIQFKLPNATIIGATTDGEIFNGKAYTNSTIVSISTFSNTTLCTHYVDYDTNHTDDFRHIGKLLASNTIQNNTQAVILFSDGLKTNGEDLVKGFQSIKSDIIIAGGLAGDSGKFHNTFVFLNNKIIQNGSVAVGLNSDILKVTTQYDFNYQALGKDLVITRAIKNRVYEIDNIKAIDIYKHYLGTNIAQMLPNIGIEFPLILNKNGIKIARAVLQKHDDGSLTFGGNLSNGDIVHIGYGDVENIIEKSIDTLNDYKHINAQSTFIYSCMARRRLMGKSINLELSPFNSISTNCGFFTYGEYFHFGTCNEFLNQTMTVLFLSEDQKLEKEISIDKDIKIYNDNHIVKALTHLISISTKEIEEKNKQLLKQQKLLANSKAIAAISHQWRQPLNVLSLIISKMKFYYKNSLLSPEKIEKFLDDSEKTVDNLSDVIDQFKTLFLHLENETKAILIQDLITKAKQNIDQELLKYNIHHTIDYNQNELSIIHTDMDKVVSVLNAIYENAVEAIRECPQCDKNIYTKINISYNMIDISIFNSGDKIKDDIIENLFEPYFSTKDDNERGLGLYIAKILVEDHLGGKLLVSSDEQGTTFTVKLYIKEH
jgi:signal transduction histidine kinase